MSQPHTAAAHRSSHILPDTYCQGAGCCRHPQKDGEADTAKRTSPAACSPTFAQHRGRTTSAQTRATCRGQHYYTVLLAHPSLLYCCAASASLRGRACQHKCQAPNNAIPATACEPKTGQERALRLQPAKTTKRSRHGNRDPRTPHTCLQEVPMTSAMCTWRWQLNPTTSRSNQQEGQTQAPKKVLLL